MSRVSDGADTILLVNVQVQFSPFAIFIATDEPLGAALPPFGTSTVQLMETKFHPEGVFSVTV